MNWVVKTSTIHVATANKQASFQSVDELPRELKQEIKKALDGPDTETIYIANQAAYERIGELVREQEESKREFNEEGQHFHRKRLALAALGAALSAAALTWIVLTIFGKQ